MMRQIKLTKQQIITLLSIILPGGILIWLTWKYFFKDAIGSTGLYDDEGGLPPDKMVNTTSDAKYSINPVKLNYFKIEEFDSPDAPGSGVNMRVSTLLLLDKARSIAGVPFIINSGYRTKAHNDSLRKSGSVKYSSHLEGYAADIDFNYGDLETAKKIAKALVQAGFKRLGIYHSLTASFIHADNDPTKPQNEVWPKGAVPFDPFKL